jgi:hypothetical protein
MLVFTKESRDLGDRALLAAGLAVTVVQQEN